MFDKTDELLIFGKGFNYSQDGPGNRLVYHLKGCNLHCPWCSNPEGLQSSNDEKGVPVTDIINEVISCSPMFFDGGGVTFTGGEILCQARAVKNILVELKKSGIHTAVETNASLPSFLDIMPYIDFLIADYKHPDAKTLKDTTGASLITVTENLRSRALSGKPMLVRTLLVRGFNDSCEDLEKLSDFFIMLKSLGNKEYPKFELLRYHEYGKDKWIKAGLSYKVKNGFISDEKYLEIVKKLKQKGITIINT